jgi:hypothetical protein
MSENKKGAKEIHVMKMGVANDFDVFDKSICHLSDDTFQDG